MNDRSRQTLLRVMLGLVAAVASAAALVWVLVLLQVDQTFQRLPELVIERDDEVDLQRMVAYSRRLEELLARDPSNGVIRKRLCRRLARMREYERALRQLEQALQTSNTPDTLFFSGYERQAQPSGRSGRDHGERGRAESDLAAVQQLLPAPAQPPLDMVQRPLVSENRPWRENAEVMQYKRDFARASINWAIAAPCDKNSYLFLGNHYIGPPLHAQLAYRNFLLGLSQPGWMSLTEDFMIEPVELLGTTNRPGPVIQILRYFAKPYRGIDFGISAQRNTTAGATNP